MDTIDYLFSARVSNTTGPMQRCRARDPEHKLGRSIAFTKEWPQLATNNVYNNEVIHMNRKTSTSHQSVSLEGSVAKKSKARESRKAVHEVVDVGGDRHCLLFSFWNIR